MLRKGTFLAGLLFVSAALAQSPQPPVSQQPGQPPNADAAPLQQPAPEQRGTETQPFVIKVLEPPNNDAAAAQDQRARQEEAVNSRNLTAYTGDLAAYTSKLAWFTGALAFFTFLLFVVAGVQVYFFWSQLRIMRIGLDDTAATARAAVESATLARDEFNATHRPKVIVRFIQGPFHKGPDDAITAYITFASIGDSDARIVAIGACLAVREDGAWLAPGLNATPKAVEPIVLPSASRHTIQISGVEGEEGEILSFHWGFIDATTPNPKGEICAMGEIQYLDKNGLRRQTGFIRVYDPKSKSWHRDKNSDYEYED